jgi:hypothetical protein
VFLEVWAFPYSVVLDGELSKILPPSLIFSSDISTLSPTFTHPDYEIIPTDCLEIEAPHEPDTPTSSDKSVKSISSSDKKA